MERDGQKEERGIELGEGMVGRRTVHGVHGILVLCRHMWKRINGGRQLLNCFEILASWSWSLACKCEQ